MHECPLKEEFECRATAELILESRCYGCPFADREILNNPHDGFGSRIGYRVDDVSVHFGSCNRKEVVS